MATTPTPDEEIAGDDFEDLGTTPTSYEDNYFDETDNEVME